MVYWLQMGSFLFVERAASGDIFVSPDFPWTMLRCEIFASWHLRPNIKRIFLQRISCCCIWVVITFPRFISEIDTFLRPGIFILFCWYCEVNFSESKPPKFRFKRQMNTSVEDLVQCYMVKCWLMFCREKKWIILLLVIIICYAWVFHLHVGRQFLQSTQPTAVMEDSDLLVWCFLRDLSSPQKALSTH